MVKPQIRIIRTIVILLMLGVSPLSVSYSFAEIEDNQEVNSELRAILTEKMVDGKLKVSHYALPEELSDEDFKRKLSFDSQTSWAYVNYKAYNSGIVIFDGKASKIGENLWDISTDEYISENLSFKVVFSENNMEIDEESVYALALMNLMIKNPETIQDIRLLQIGEMTINSEKSIGSNQEFKNSISVK
ncbi:MAG: hypothetical protein ACE5RC_00550 [Nitrosopumilus sp.]